MHYTCFEPRLEDVLQKGFAEITVNEANVDAIGVLFENITSVNKISYQVQKTCNE